MDFTDMEREILKQLKGRSFVAPMPRKYLADYLRSKGIMLSKKDDRPMREAFETLRKKGYLLCHRKGKDGGYFMAGSMDEYVAFREREYKSRISTLADTMRKMDKAAELQFSDEIQLELFYL